MNIIKDMPKFVQMKAAMAMEKAAENQGEAGAGVGLGMGMLLPAMFSKTFAALDETGELSIICPDCQHGIPADAHFCPVCGHQQVILSRCGYCGKNLSPKARFCSQCGKQLRRSN